MKTFYTERDVEDLHARGVSAIELSDHVVLTDLAREKAEKLGIALVAPGEQPPASPPVPAAAALTAAPPNSPEIVSLVKARVIARLGTNEYNDLLDQIIPKVMARLNGPASTQTKESSQY